MNWMKHIALVLAVVAMVVGPGCTNGSLNASWDSQSKEPDSGGTKMIFAASAGIDYDHESTKHAIDQFYDLVDATFRPIVGLFVPSVVLNE